MPKKKVKLPSLSAKETLLAFCSTLSEPNAKKAYIILTEEFEIHRPKILKFNADGIEDKKGRVRLRSQDYKKIIEQLGELYFHRACELMSSYIEYLEQKAPYESQARSKLRMLKTTNHYIPISRGWVAQRIEKEDNEREATSKPENERLDFYKINTIEEAKQYILSLPIDLRENNPEVVNLFTRFPELMMEKDI